MMHRTEPTAQQNLALQLAEKLGNLVENNERVFDHKQGSYGGYFRGPPRPRATPARPALAPHPSPLFSTPQIKKTATGKETAATCAAAVTVSRSAAPTTEPRPAPPRIKKKKFSRSANDSPRYGER